MNRAYIIAVFSCLLFTAVLSGTAAAQEQRIPDKVRDGEFEITLKTLKPTKVWTYELIRDRDVNPTHIFRVKAGGYLSFDENEWVRKVEFKVYDRPVAELPDYKRFAELMVELNTKIWAMKEMLSSYDSFAFRLMLMGNKSFFRDIEAVDHHLTEQLTVYRKLVLLRALVVNSLERFVRDRTLKDNYDDYKKSLTLYGKQLKELSRDVDRLSRRALQVAGSVKSVERIPAVKSESEKKEEPATR